MHGETGGAKRAAHFDTDLYEGERQRAPSVRVPKVPKVPNTQNALNPSTLEAQFVNEFSVCGHPRQEIPIPSAVPKGA